MKKPLILVCSSHIDPVWLWEWEEGVAETLSTFRTAVKFCEENKDFVFCHNESLLYEWVEKYNPALFLKIREQVKAGRWYIMGGWYLQPDCNLLLGESIVRQIITGKKYFLEKFGKEPATAINFDSFGHSRGLVQVLADAGYNSYLFCRPDKDYLNLPDDTFTWLGFDGSTIMAHRAPDHYNSRFGQASKKINDWIVNSSEREREAGMILWGVGNHGGGPSEKDLAEINILRKKGKTWNIKHGFPEEYFSHFTKSTEKLQVFKGDLNPFAIGCYTSMKSIKQPLYQLEHKFFLSEKLLTQAAVSTAIVYPKEKMDEALREILFCQFHDILPGSSVDTVERDVLHRIGHATRIIENETASLLINIGNSLKPAAPGEFPLMLINPHPFNVDEIIEIELQLTEPNFERTKKRIPQVFNEKGIPVPFQSERPLCNIKDDHRKRIVFRAQIPAGEIRRYSCFLKDIPEEEFTQRIRKDLTFLCNKSKLVFDETAGLPGKNLPSVYISENGPIRTVIESLFAYKSSKIHLRHIISAGKPGFDVEITVYWMEKDKLLKWIIPVGFDMNCLGRSISGINCCKHRKREFVMRDWLGMKNFEWNDTFSICSDGAYGYDIVRNSVRISLLRSPAYSGHPVEGEENIVMTDRAVKRIDQGIHTFRFRFIPGNADEIIDKSFNDSDLFNNPVICRIVYPSGEEGYNYSGIRISDKTINLQSVKLNDNGDMIIRLLNPCKESRRLKISVPSANAEAGLEIESKKLKTWLIKKADGEFLATDLLERTLSEIK